jgi:ribosomal protein S17E
MLWVKGHQDKYTARNKLSQQAGMNIQADALADQYREQNQHTHNQNQLLLSRYDPIPGQELQLIMNGYVVTQLPTRWIRHQISGYNMRVYLQDKND